MKWVRSSASARIKTWFELVEMMQLEIGASITTRSRNFSFYMKENNVCELLSMRIWSSKMCVLDRESRSRTSDESHSTAYMYIKDQFHKYHFHSFALNAPMKNKCDNKWKKRAENKNESKVRCKRNDCNHSLFKFLQKNTTKIVRRSNSRPASNQLNRHANSYLIICFAVLSGCDHRWHIKPKN